MGDGSAFHKLIVLFAVVLEGLDGGDFHVPLSGVLKKLGHPHHGSVLLHDFTAEPAFTETGQAHQVNGGFGMSGPFQHSVFSGCQRKHVAGTPEILRPGPGIYTLSGRYTPFGRGNAGGGAYVVNGNSKGCLVVVGIVGYHLGKLKPCTQFRAHGHADKAFAVHCHEIHVFCGCMLGGADKIALIFPVFIVCHQYDFSLAQFVQYFFYGAESFYGVESFHGAINPPCF